MTMIISKKVITESVKVFTIESREIAQKAQPGQFVIVRVDEKSERIPLTIADFDRDAGTITLAVQEVGATTKLIGIKKEGESFAGVVGPLGMASHMETCGTVVCIGGGIGIACMHPIARGFAHAGNEVISIIGARNESLLLFQDRLEAFSKEVIVMTDDGSAGEKGFVTQALENLISLKKIDLVYAVGPVVMMAAVTDITKKHAIKTLVSLNPIMVDGTGMCGGCRVTVNGEQKFACVDGPDFDAHTVDFTELLQRQAAYKKDEACHLEYMIKKLS